LIAAAALPAADGDREEAALRRRLGLLRGLAAVVSGVAAAAVLGLAAPRVGGGAVTGPAAGALALLPLALLPVLDDLLVAAARAARLAPVLGRLAPLLAPVEVPDDAGRDPGPVHEVRFHDLAVRYPGAASPVFAGLSARAARGARLAVVGPSGSGKSTLLAALLRHLPPATGDVLLDGVPSEEFAAPGVRRRIAWAPQEAHVFDSTLRGNLLLARTADDRPSDGELREVLRRVGLGPFVAASPSGLDTPVGPGGSFLSGGQRQRVAVARALLARADVLLLDEPTAHLDRDAADALLADLDAALEDRVQILVTHDPAAARAAAERVELGRRSRTDRLPSSTGTPSAPARPAPAPAGADRTGSRSRSGAVGAGAPSARPGPGAERGVLRSWRALDRVDRRDRLREVHDREAPR
jgi:ATP-binding cassette subfamily C protein CydCD